MMARCFWKTLLSLFRMLNGTIGLRNTEHKRISTEPCERGPKPTAGGKQHFTNRLRSLRRQWTVVASDDPVTISVFLLAVKDASSTHISR